MTDSNLDDILYALEMAYMESQRPLETPMSTREDIQNVIDPYLEPNND